MRVILPFQAKSNKIHQSQHNHAKYQKAILAIDGAHVMQKILRLSLEKSLVLPRSNVQDAVRHERPQKCVYLHNLLALSRIATRSISFFCFRVGLLECRLDSVGASPSSLVSAAAEADCRVAMMPSMASALAQMAATSTCRGSRGSLMANRT
mmetsp:Transcript_4417/g.7878  ORF Transcript_4417/g.7878 Transcript_4417/m.7878 type:complete len:152 (+) Transcript_4417:2001-2456(+)